MDKACMECGTPIKGRADKKFCDDNCRSVFNNKRNSDTSAYMKRVNHALRKNRGILASLNPGGKGKASRKQLMSSGFDFDHFTSQYINKDGKVYRYCYEQGYLPMENDMYFLVVKLDPEAKN